MSVVETSFEINSPAATVFDYVADYRNTPSWMFGLIKFEPITELTRGLGAEFDGNLKVGVPLKSKLRTTAFEEGHRMVLSSFKGIKNEWDLRVTDLGGDRSRVDAVVTYELPGGPVGKAMSAAVKPAVSVVVNHTTNTLKGLLEG